MAPNAQKAGEIIGFKRGFKIEDNDWQKDFQKSEWSNFGNGKELNKEKFQSAYLEEYEKGKKQRQIIQKEFELKLGKTTNLEREIQDKYLNQIFDIFHRTSYLFKSWEERIQKELFPQNEDLSPFKIIHLITSKKYQKGLQNLKALSIKDRNSNLYYEVLGIDFQLKKLRIESKLKTIDNIQYQDSLLKIENQLSEIKKKLKTS